MNRVPKMCIRDRREAGSVQTKVAIKHADEKRAEIIVPDNPGKQLHLILEPVSYTHLR